MLGLSEAQIQRSILDLLTARGILAWTVDAGGRALRRGQDPHGSVAPRGLPDLQGVLPGGRALFIEVKRPEWLTTSALQWKPAGEVSQDQARWLQALAASGAVVGVAWSVEDAEEILERAR